MLNYLNTMSLITPDDKEFLNRVKNFDQTYEIVTNFFLENLRKKAYDLNCEILAFYARKPDSLTEGILDISNDHN